MNKRRGQAISCVDRNRQQGNTYMKVITIFGTRPEAIKMCPLIIQLKKTKQIDCVVCLTGQHREMLRQVMDIFAIQEDYNLDIMRPDQSLSTITADILNDLEVYWIRKILT